jgi:hypothetical protein
MLAVPGCDGLGAAERRAAATACLTHLRGAGQDATAMRHWRRVHHAAALQARPGGVPANATTRLVADQYAAGAEPVAGSYLFPVAPDLSISALTVSAVVSSDRAW